MHRLQDEFLSIDDDGMAGIVSAGIAGNNREAFREHIDNFAFALVAPLRAYDDRSLASFQSQLRGEKWRPPRPHCGVAHTLAPGRKSQNYWDKSGNGVYETS